MLKIHKLGGDELLSLLVTVKVGVVNLCEGLTLDFLRIGLTITIITFKDTCPKVVYCDSVSRTTPSRSKRAA